MKQAYITFCAELNDFLLPERRSQTLSWAFEVSGSVKDVLESIGVPHTEVDVILANGKSVDFTYRVRDGDRITVYPPAQSIGTSPLVHLQPRPPLEARFIADTHLGRLTAYLRMLGFDALYDKSFQDENLAQISASEDRTLLTRDRGLLKRNEVVRGYFLRATDPARQLAEVIQRFALKASIRPFRLCIHCNTLLQATSKESIADRLLSETKQYYDEFYVCPQCARIYWKGSHYRRMRRFIDSVTASA